MDLTALVDENKSLLQKNASLENEVISLLHDKTDLRLEVQNLNLKVRLLEEDLKLALFKRFGKSSESIKGQPDLPFGEDVSAETVEPEKEKHIDTETISYTRGKPGRKRLSPDLPREHITHDLPDSEKTCACGHSFVKIGEDVVEKLNVIPPKLWVEVHHYAKYACTHCEGVNGSGEPGVKTAKDECSLIPGSILTPGLAAFVLTNKFCDHLPFYRQEAGFERIGALVSRQDMSNWTIRLAEELEPLVKLIEDDIRAGPVIGMDETPVKVLKLDHTGKDGRGYMWLAIGGPDGQRAVRYRFAPGRGHAHAESFLGDYGGFVQSDGHKAYDAANKTAQWTHVGCWAHARRKFFEANKVAHSSLLTDALGRIRKLYALEDEARERKLKPPEFLEYRRSKIEPFLKELKEWAEKTVSTILPSGKSGGAFAYMLGQWDKLVKFLDHEELTPDNNRAENAIRPFVLGRKNWLFGGNENGIEASCRIFSLIESAKRNRVDPYAYLLFVFSALQSFKKTGEWKSLLPWNASLPPTGRN